MKKQKYPSEINTQNTRLYKSTKERLDKLALSRFEPYDKIINRILDQLDDYEFKK